MEVSYYFDYVQDKQSSVHLIFIFVFPSVAKG